MHRRREPVTLTLRFLALSVTDSVPGDVFIRWQRRGKCGTSPSQPVPENKFFTYDSAFVMSCNFKVTHKGWKSKKIDIDVILNSGGSRSRIHRWTFDLAQMERVDIITTDLKATAPPLGELCLTISVFRGSLAPESQTKNPEPTRKLVKTRSIPPQAPLIQLGSGLRPGKDLPEHGLGSLRRQTRRDSMSARSPRPPRPFGGEFAQELDAASEKLFNEELRYEDGVPSYAVEVIGIFMGQSRGANFVTPVAMVTQSLTQRARRDLQTALYCFFALAYVFTELKFNGFETESPNVSMQKKMLELCKLCADKLDLEMDEITDEKVANVKEIFSAFSEPAFVKYASEVILFYFCVTKEPATAKRLLVDLGVTKAEFFDKCVMDCEGSQEHLVPPDEALEKCAQFLLDAPVPSMS